MAMRGAGGVVAGSKAGAEVQAWSPGPRVPSCLSGSKKHQSIWVWTTLGVVSGWVCPRRRGGTLGSLG